MAQEQTPSPSQEKQVRLVRPSIVLLCGPAACGKSTFAQRHFRPTQIISSDWARARVCDDERDQRFQAQAFALVHCLTELRLSLNRLCVVDSTALSPAHRREYLEMAKRFQVPCVVFLFNVSLEKCVERDRSRERTVGSPVIEHQYQAFGQTKADIRQEGFDQIIEIGDEDLDRVRIEIIFRPIPQPAGGPGRRPDGETRHTNRPWAQRTGRGPAVRDVKPPLATHLPAPSAPAKLESLPASATAKAAYAPATGPSQTSNVAGPSPPIQPLPTSSQGTSQTTPDTKVTPRP